MSVPIAVERLALSNDRFRAVLTVLALFVASMAAMVAAGTAIDRGLAWSPLVFDSTVRMALAMSIGEVLALGVIAVGYLGLAGPPVSLAWPARREAWLVVGAAIFVTAGALVQRAVAGELDPDTTSMGAELLRSAPLSYAAIAVLGSVFAPIVEEFLFRGAIQGRLRTVTGPGGAIAGASLLFVPLHLSVRPGSILVAVLGATAIGLTSIVFGVAYERTANLAVPIVIHAVSNSVVFVIVAGRALL
ncbi:MAG: CPBP family intramembrane glutamic endopeptidase [Halococcoides sp.]